MGLVGKKQHTVKFSMMRAVLRGKVAATNGACATFSFNYGTDVHFLHNFRVPLPIYLLFLT